MIQTVVNAIVLCFAAHMIGDYVNDRPLSTFHTVP